MAVTELQRIVDGLRERLQRPVILDDPAFRLLAHSTQDEVVDEVRRHAILHRQPPEAAKRYARSLGMQRATDPMVLPANPAIGMDARLGVPVRADGQLVGFLFISATPPLDDGEVAAAVAAASEAAAAIRRDQALADRDRTRERELVADLLGDDATARTKAAAALVDEELFTPDGPVVAVAVDAALERARIRLPHRRAIHLTRPDHGVLIVATAELEGRGRTPLDLAEELRHDTDAAHAAVGAPRGALVDAWRSAVEASRALRVLNAVPALGPVAAWDQLGVYALLSQFPLDELADGGLHPGVVALFGAKDGPALTATLQAFLDRGGDVGDTAAALGLHRGTLYHRLRKVERLAGIDLKDGNDRLAVHLSLHLARLAGLHPTVLHI
jgi:hypothetical protein